MQHELCKITDVPATGSKVVPFFGREANVYRTGDRIRVVANVCLHFGGPPDCKDGKFVCPWHNASYDMDSGERIDGPAPPGSKLMFFSTKVENGVLFYVWGG